jgi:hypothetical protein
MRMKNTVVASALAALLAATAIPAVACVDVTDPAHPRACGTLYDTVPFRWWMMPRTDEPRPLPGDLAPEGKAGIRIGETAADVARHCGRPSSVNSTRTAGGVAAQWVYELDKSCFGYIYMQDDVVTAIQD